MLGSFHLVFRRDIRLPAFQSTLLVAASLMSSCDGASDIDFFPRSETGGESTSDEGKGAEEDGGIRDPYSWPFSSQSIWNMPLGTDAQFSLTGLLPVSGKPMTGNISVIILRPDAPLVSLFENGAAWTGGDRCVAEGAELFQLPVPDDFIVPNNRENNSLAALLPDGRTIKQAQPFARCVPGGLATALVAYPDADIFGAGREGASGGSGLSSLGGTLRVGELRPGGAPVRHTLKLSVSAENLMACSDPADCYRWPAVRGDASAPNEYTGELPELTMGSLLALPPTVTVEDLALETEPGRMLAQVLADYGGYVSNQTGASIYALSVETGPDGDFMDQFQQDWGLSFEADAGTPWTNDVVKIFQELRVVTNNTLESVGGGGLPVVPLAPPLLEP